MVDPVQPLVFWKSNYILTLTVERSRFAKIYKIRKRLKLQDCLVEFMAFLKLKTFITAKQSYLDQANEYVSFQKLDSTKRNCSDHFISVHTLGYWDR